MHQSLTMDLSVSIAFVDLQGFEVNGKFVLKEICYQIVPRTTDAIWRKHTGVAQRFHYVYKPPFAWEYLDKNARRKCLWQSAFRHGIYWNDGSVPYNRIDQTIELLRLPNLRIYVKGENNCGFLNDLLRTWNPDIRNIENFGADFSLEDFTPAYKNCGSHKHNTRLCAIQSVRLIRDWFLQHGGFQEADRE